MAERDALYAFCHNIVYFSVLAYAEAPSMYIPYFFLCLYNVLTAIADLFEIELPALPSQRSYKKRFLLYYELCETFAQWRDEQGLSSAELCAFLYDFGPKYAGGINWLWKKLPEPRAAFVIGAPPTASKRWQAAGEGAIFAWQGNPDTQPGDIIVMYQWAPTSAITSIWEAVSPGFVDPFFVHYRCIYIGNQKNVLPLSYQILKSDAVLGQTALVKTRMLGMDGTELKPSQYKSFGICCPRADK